MKHFVITLIIMATAFPVCQARYIKPSRLTVGGENVAPKKPQKLISDNTLIIYYNNSKGRKNLLKEVKKYNATIIYDYKNLNSVAIKIPDGVDIHDAKAHFEKVKGVVGVNYDRIMQLM